MWREKIGLAVVRRRGSLLTVSAASALVALAVAALLWQWTALYLSADNLTPRDRITSKSQLLDTAIKVLGGLLIATTLWSTWRNLHLARESHITERYASAIAMLGEPSNEAKQLGGVYALERLARDSAVDRSTVLEVLSAVARSSRVSGSHGDVPALYSRRVLEAVVVVLGRCPSAGLKRLDLRGADLTGFDLTGVHLDRADLQNAILDGAILRGAMLREALLTHATMVEADASGAILDNAVLNFANLSRANFFRARLRGIEARTSTLPEVSFAQADLTGASFNESTLEKCIFTRARLVKIAAQRVKLRGANFQDATVIEADFTDSEISEAVQITEKQIGQMRGVARGGAAKGVPSA